MKLIKSAEMKQVRRNIRKGLDKIERRIASKVKVIKFKKKEVKNVKQRG